MGKCIWLLLLLLPGALACRAQQPPEKLRYELAESILEALPPHFVYAPRSPDGQYHRQRSVATDTPVVRLLLLDHSYSTNADYQFVLASEGTPERAQVMRYFSPGDVTYMRAQLPASKLFRFKQAEVSEPWVTVIALDTVTAINKRLRWQAHFLALEAIFQRYGSDRILAIGDALFSKDHKRALVNVGTGDGWETRVYTKAGTVWHVEETLLIVEY